MNWLQGRTLWWIVYAIQVLLVLAAGLRVGWLLRKRRYPYGDINNMDVYHLMTALRGPDYKYNGWNRIALFVKEVFTARLRHLAGVAEMGAYVNAEIAPGPDWEESLARIGGMFRGEGTPPWWGHWVSHMRDGLRALKQLRPEAAGQADILLEMLLEVYQAMYSAAEASAPPGDFSRHIRTDPPPSAFGKGT